ncbi:MAG: ferrous iron transport protein B [Oligoflexia bacterium]|nr:ferrous iron transport protein B [Oligoflexia bacterium]
MSADTPRIALAGNPNCGKTALFNALTGGRQKVGNYPGVTVERKEGTLTMPSGLSLSVLDLPGTYSLDASSPDELITRDVILGLQPSERRPEILVAVADATNLERNLGLVLELRALGKGVLLALNMMDLAEQRGIELDLAVLSKELGVPIVPTVAVRGKGIPELLKQVEELLQSLNSGLNGKSSAGVSAKAAETAQSVAPESWRKPSSEEIRSRFAEVDRVLKLALRRPPKPALWTERIDRVVLHPLWGSLLLGAVLVIMFQAIFSWASAPADLIEAGVGWLGETVQAGMAEGPLRSLIVDGAIAGVGSVLVFLPQILLLFLFILLLEDSGYMSRAAFLMDRLMSRVGLHGRAFIPLLSSYACAVPGIMAARTISSRRDRLTTILVAPLTTCSARLPVYSLLIAAFIPNVVVVGPLRLQGLVMFGLYLGGILATLVMAMIFRKSVFRGPKSPLLMELPSYKWPSVRNIVLGLLERAKIFVRRAGTVILLLSVVLWFLAAYPKPGAEDAVDPAHPAITYSYAGKIGRAIEPLMRPLGFDWRVSIALIPGFAAREVMVSALATVYSIEGGEDEAATALGERLARDWTLPVALSLLVWYVLACQCLSTLAVTRRETNSWLWPMVMLGYMTALAYLGSFATYRLALWLGL